MSEQPNDLAATLEGLAALVEGLEAVTSLSALVDRLNRLLDDVEIPLRMLAPHLVRATSSADRAGDLVTLLSDTARAFGPLTTILRGVRPTSSAHTTEPPVEG